MPADVDGVVRARRSNNLPLPGRDRRLLRYRILTSPWTWVTLAAALIFALCLYLQYRLQTANTVLPGGINPGLPPAAIQQAAWYALPTLAFWIVVFLVVDRFRPQRPLIWFLALGWGACVATWLAVNVNTWAASHLGVVGTGDPTAAARASIFVAPFVEEAMKATVLFWMAALVRYRLVSKVTLVCLGGLSAAGFAFTENIIYYAQAIMYAAQNISVGNAQDAVTQTVLQRGVYTAFGHPLFTIMTAIGVAIGVRSRSKVVRIFAPLAGYMIAVGLHMTFNSQISLEPENVLMMLYVVALLLVLSVVIYVVRQVLVQGRLMRVRLADYVRAGWLEPDDPAVFARLRTRLRADVIAVSRGWRCWLATNRLQRAMTELAYLRDAEVRGLVDSAGSGRARELLRSISEMRTSAVADPHGQRVRWPALPSWRAKKTSPLPGALTPATGYSAVDPLWGPPQG